MPNFLSAPDNVREDIYNALAPKLGMTPAILEKDVWVCWTLDVLFSMPDRNQMAFKGGTSLSKAYDAISRFSEDLDVTVAHKLLDPTLMVFDETIGHRAMSKKLSLALVDYVKNEIEPHFRSKLDVQFPVGSWALDIANNGDELRLTYPTVTAVATEIDPSLIRDYIKLEFGGRNATDPVDEIEVQSYISDLVPGLTLPVAKTRVLSAARTFWEKVTLAHNECNRPDLKPNADRLSRHWYDLYLLADSEFGVKALSDIALLQDVVKYKKLFFNSEYANFDECLVGRVRIIPNFDLIALLESDYKAMLAKKMIYGEIPTFEQITKRLKELEVEINAKVLAELTST